MPCSPAQPSQGLWWLQDISNEPRELEISMVAWNLVYNIARVTRNLWIKPALNVAEAVATVFVDKDVENADDVESEE